MKQKNWYSINLKHCRAIVVEKGDRSCFGIEGDQLWVGLKGRSHIRLIAPKISISPLGTAIIPVLNHVRLQ